MFQAGSIVGKMGLDISGWTRSMLEANAISALFPATVRNFLASPLLGLIGVAQDAARSIKEAFLEIGRAADNAGEAAEKAGVSVEFLTGVGAAAQDAGSSVEGLADSLKFLNNNAADAASGNKVTAKAFRDLGVSVVDAAGQVKDTEELFYDVADAIAELETPQQKVQAAMNLLGRGGVDMIATLNKGSMGIKTFAADIKALGGTIDQDLANAGDKFGTLETYVSAAWTGIKRAVAEPILQYVAAHFEEVKAKIFAFASQARQFIAEHFIPAMQKLGQIVQWVAEHWRGLLTVIEAFLAYKVATSVISSIGAAFTALVPQIQAATAAKLAFNAAMSGAGLGAAMGAGVYGGVGGTVGGGVGGLIGGLLGSFIPIPVVGTLLGQALGSIAGGWIGSQFNEQPQTNIGAVNVNMQYDPRQTAQAVAQEMQPQITAEVARHQRRAVNEYRQQFVGRAL